MELQNNGKDLIQEPVLVEEKKEPSRGRFRILVVILLVGMASVAIGSVYKSMHTDMPLLRGN